MEERNGRSGIKWPILIRVIDMNLKTCQKKIAKGNVYNTRQAADRAALELDRLLIHDRVHAFECKYCNNFHIGGMTGRRHEEPRRWSF